MISQEIIKVTKEYQSFKQQSQKLKGFLNKPNPEIFKEEKKKRNSPEKKEIKNIRTPEILENEDKKLKKNFTNDNKQKIKNSEIGKSSENLKNIQNFIEECENDKSKGLSVKKLPKESVPSEIEELGR